MIREEYAIHRSCTAAEKGGQKGGIPIRTMKIVGISGAGKSTLLKRAKERNPALVHISYGELYRQYGENQADIIYLRLLSGAEGMVLVDEHLEFGEYDWAASYRRENTVGILFLEVDPAEIYQRRLHDATRDRPLDMAAIVAEQAKARTIAAQLSATLRIPLVVVSDASVEEEVLILERFMEELSERHGAGVIPIGAAAGRN